MIKLRVSRIQLGFGDIDIDIARLIGQRIQSILRRINFSLCRENRIIQINGIKRCNRLTLAHVIAFCDVDGGDFASCGEG